MNLSIEVIQEYAVIEDVFEGAIGRITIGDHWETLHLPVDYWSVADYKRQWQEAIKRLRFHDRSCLVVSIHDPKQYRFIEWWSLYRIRGKVYIRNQFVFGRIYDKRIGNKKFTVTNCYNFVGPRTRGKVSEWVVDYP